MDNLAYFLDAVVSHLDDKGTDKFLNKEFSNQNTNILLKDLYNYINHRINGTDSSHTDIFAKRVKFVLNSRFTNKQLADATGLTESTISTCRQDPKGHAAFKYSDNILRFYEKSLAKYLHPEDIKYLPE